MPGNAHIALAIWALRRRRPGRHKGFVFAPSGACYTRALETCLMPVESGLGGAAPGHATVIRAAHWLCHDAKLCITFRLMPTDIAAGITPPPWVRPGTEASIHIKCDAVR